MKYFECLLLDEEIYFVVCIEKILDGCLDSCFIKGIFLIENISVMGKSLKRRVMLTELDH